MNNGAEEKEEIAVREEKRVQLAASLRIELSKRAQQQAAAWPGRALRKHSQVKGTRLGNKSETGTGRERIRQEPPSAACTQLNLRPNSEEGKVARALESSSSASQVCK